MGRSGWQCFHGKEEPEGLHELQVEFHESLVEFWEHEQRNRALGMKKVKYGSILTIEPEGSKSTAGAALWWRRHEEESGAARWQGDGNKEKIDGDNQKARWRANVHKCRSDGSSHRNGRE